MRKSKLKVLETESANLTDYHKIIEDGFKHIFQTHTLRGSQTQEFGGFNGAMTIVREPLVKQQIIQLAKLCQEVPANVILKSYRNKVFIEFWV